MESLNIQKYMLYCMGMGYFNQKKYASDLAYTRSANRVLQSQLDLMSQGERVTALKPFQQSALAQRPLPVIIAVAQTILQRSIVQPLQGLLQQAAQMAQTLVATMGTLAGRALGLAEATVSKILTFFFGAKKARDDERDKRDKDDLAGVDVFENRKVDASQGGAQGGQR